MTKKKKNITWILAATSIITLFLVASLFISYLSQNLEGFNDLNTTFSVSFFYQILLFLIFVSLNALYFFKTQYLKVWLAGGVVSLLVFISTYSVTFSSSINSISSEIGPFTVNSIDYSKNLVIERTWYGYLINDNKKLSSITLVTNLSPLVFYSNHLNQYIDGLGQCIEYEDKQCLKVKVSWP